MFKDTADESLGDSDKCHGRRFGTVGRMNIYSSDARQRVEKTAKTSCLGAAIFLHQWEALIASAARSAQLRLGHGTRGKTRGERHRKSPE